MKTSGIPNEIDSHFTLSIMRVFFCVLGDKFMGFTVCDQDILDKFFDFDEFIKFCVPEDGFVPIPSKHFYNEEIFANSKQESISKGAMFNATI